MIGRIVATFVAAVVCAVLEVAYWPQAARITGQVAGRQFENSDSGYTTRVYVSRATQGAGIAIGLLFLLALVLIWYKPVRDAMKNASTTMMLLFVLAVTLLGTADSRAFFEKTDRTEIIPILPNQS